MTYIALVYILCQDNNSTSVVLLNPAVTLWDRYYSSTNKKNKNKNKT